MKRELLIVALLRAAACRAVAPAVTFHWSKENVGYDLRHHGAELYRLHGS